MSTSHYTESEKSELWAGFGDRLAIQKGSAWTEEFVKGIIHREKELGLIGRQRPIPERYKRNIIVAPTKEGESNGEETS